MKIVFFGSDDFAVAHLAALAVSPHKVVACVTPPDKPKGRHLHVASTAVKEFALKNKIELLQPDNVTERNLVERLKAFDADVFVVIAYGKILPKAILEIPKIFCVNVHASLLPKYRGAAPINWAIINGEEETGITIFKLAEAVDSGEIISQKAIPILETDTALSLRRKLSQLGAERLVQTLDFIEKGSYTLTKQDSKKVSLAPKLTKDQGSIKWSDDAEHIHNLVRGLLPWPGAFCLFQGKRLKILETQVVDISDSPKAGEVIDIAAKGFVVATGQKGLLVSFVHPESSREMDAKSFLAGHKLSTGFNFLE